MVIIINIKKFLFFFFFFFFFKQKTAYEIDNLLKAALDGIFRGLEVKDSRVALVSMGKFQEMENPRTEIVLRGIE
ncbi:RusA family crossover junction endodeoxyribonuclease [Staphylococcus warneri]|uniref:RusA family crossover junction endodeoxyribonuclease n=1 Tax=Staphylococcus warneri TaxID=1292 RepID=UPI0039F5A305